MISLDVRLNIILTYNYIMDIKIGYFKITPYIFEIDILYLHSDNRVSMLTHQQKLNATYNVIIFKVISIKNMITQMLISTAHNFEINKIYEDFRSYYLTYDRAFNEKFFENNEFKLFPNGYTGLYNVYDEDGNIMTSFYHNNGCIQGEALIYNNLGFVKYVYFYKNNKIKIKYDVELDKVIT